VLEPAAVDGRRYKAMDLEDADRIVCATWTVREGCGDPSNVIGVYETIHWRMAFWTWRRFSACSKMVRACCSKVSSVISFPRHPGRQYLLNSAPSLSDIPIHSIKSLMNKSIERLLHPLVLALIALSGGCSRTEIVTPTHFTLEFSEALKKADPKLKVEIVRNLELKVINSEGRESGSFLHNAYDQYKKHPKAKDDVIQRFVSSWLECLRTVPDGIDRTLIVPIIKDRPWLEETRRALSTRGAKAIPEPVYEDFNDGLVILYAQDSPKNIRYLVPHDLESANVERAELRRVACENLKRLLPKIEAHGTNGFYMLAAGGTYEASLLLLDSIWKSGQMQVTGDLLVAIPTRDLLLVTGSQDREGIEKMKGLVEKASDGGSYRLTRKLLVYREGKFVEFEPQ
jgi:uncharacterized protein YtpQ (UPF0354 family)